MRCAAMAACAVAVVVAQARPVAADTIMIPSEEPTIRAGVLAASEGDTLLLDTMTFSGPDNRNIDLEGTNLVIRSQGGRQRAEINCENAGRAFIFQSGEDASTLLDGLMIINGYVSEGNGGAVYIVGASPSVRNCIFDSNAVDAGSDLFWGGGAIYCAVSSSIISGCEFAENEATGSFASGGAIYVESASPTIESCSFVDNYCTFRAAGIHIWGSSSPQISGSSFLVNTGDAWGGAMSTMEGATPSIWDCTFTANSAYNGAGIYCAYSSPVVWQCVFEDNTATGSGAAIAAVDPSSPSFTELLCVGNEAGYSGGVFDFASNTPTVTNCTLSSNGAPNGGSIRCYGASCTPSIQNTIITGTAYSPGMLCESGANPTVNHCCSYNNPWGHGLCGTTLENIVGDPMFCDFAERDFRIDAQSACSENGNVWGELIGAYGVGCDSPVEDVSWGKVKALWR